MMQVATSLAAGLLLSALNMPMPMDPSAMDTGGFQPVYYGGGTGAACVDHGEITATTPLTDGILPVRNGPQTGFAKIDLLKAGDRIWLCDAAGDWIGVVYAPPEAPALACGQSQERPAREPYAGPCRAGWVPANRVRLPAG